MRLDLKLDKTTAILLALVAMAAVIVSFLLVNIADRSQKDGQEIKAIPVKASMDTLSALPTKLQANDSVTSYVDSHLQAKRASFSETEFTEETFAQLARLKQVQVLILSGAVFDNKWMHYLTALKQLHDLDLEQSVIDTQGLKQITSMRQVFILNLKASTITNDSLAFLPPDLVNIDICKTKIDDDGIKYLLKYSRVQCLNLAQDQLTDKGVEQLKDLTSLRELHIARMRITDACLDSVSRLTNLEVLNVTNTLITDQGLSRLYGLKKLRKFWLYNCPGITEKGVKELQRALPACEIRSVYKSTKFFD
jgi:hypothetical protein